MRQMLPEWRCKAAKREEAARGEPTGEPLVAIIRRWGMANWALGGTGPLWQILVVHVDGAGREGSFGHHLIATMIKALHHHPSPDARNLRGLLKSKKVRVLNGAPDPDKMSWGRDDWVPVMYAAGDTPYEALRVILLVMQEKVRQNLLTQMPPEFSVDWALGERPAEPLPPPWKIACDSGFYAGLQDPFRVLPPRGHEHITCELQQLPADHKYRLEFSGGVDPFKAGFEKADVPRQTCGRCRFLHDLAFDERSKDRVKQVLHTVLGGLPVELRFSVRHLDDAFAYWLQEQPTVILAQEQQPAVRPGAD